MASRTPSGKNPCLCLLSLRSCAAGVLCCCCRPRRVLQTGGRVDKCLRSEVALRRRSPRSGLRPMHRAQCSFPREFKIKLGASPASIIFFSRGDDSKAKTFFFPRVDVSRLVSEVGRFQRCPHGGEHRKGYKFSCRQEILNASAFISKQPTQRGTRAMCCRLEKKGKERGKRHWIFTQKTNAIDYDASFSLFPTILKLWLNSSNHMKASTPCGGHAWRSETASSYGVCPEASRTAR